MHKLIKLAITNSEIRERLLRDSIATCIEFGLDVPKELKIYEPNLKWLANCQQGAFRP